MAGLVAAWKLKELGVTDILVLDPNPTMGGICRKDTINGKVASRASAYSRCCSTPRWKPNLAIRLPT